MKKNRFIHSQLLQMAIPMILTGISTPLLGLVDTAVLGHLDSENFLAAVGLGSVIFSFIFWGFGFLRMGTTGLTAHAFGSNDQIAINTILIRAMVLALIISGLILLLQQPIARLSFLLLQSSTSVEQLAQQYFATRIWSTPATLCLYVFMGWFIGQQNPRIPLFVMIFSNICNIFLDLLFVYHLNLQVVGVALASVIAEYLGLLICLIIAIIRLKKQFSYLFFHQLFRLAAFKAMLRMNSHIFIRTWCLIFAFAFFTAESAKLGGMILACNTLLLNFQTFMAYALDGFAHAAEALVGKAVGAKNRVLYRQSIATAGLWSLWVAVVFTVFYLFFGSEIIDLLTGLTDVRIYANSYLPWLMVMPLVSFGCYLFDGVFIGAMLTREMRNTMLFSLFVIFLPAWYLARPLENHGLWLAMLLFMLARSLSMGLTFKYKGHLKNS